MKLFGVIGNPIKHSLSPKIHNCAIEAFGLNAYYDRFYLPSNISSSDLKSFIVDSSLCGLNVTLPFKEISINILDSIDDVAKEIGAVNTIVKRGLSLVGYNTDAFGFYRCISHLNAKHVLILGAGGSARSVANILLKHGIEISIANRSKDRLRAFENLGHTHTFDDIPKQHYDIIINATSAGVKNELPLDLLRLKDMFSRCGFVFDLMYSRDSLTAFCKLASECNVEYIDGKSMLVYQGTKSFLYFHDFEDERLDEIAKYMFSSIA